MGGLINETPVLCGGTDDDDDRQDSCIVFGNEITSIKMNVKRSGAASVVMNEKTLWIMGGESNNSTDRLSSTELITLFPPTSVNGPPLPKELNDACAVKYNESHIYLIGGHDNSDWTNQVWIYDTILDAGSSSWTEGPRMNNARGDHGCTILHYGDRSLIVVSGGVNLSVNPNTTLDLLKSVEILDLDKNEWVQGENAYCKKNNFFASNILHYFSYILRARSTLWT